MSGIAHYYVQQQSVNTQQVATLSAQVSSSGASQTSVPASFQQMSSASQPIVTQPAIPTPDRRCRHASLVWPAGSVRPHPGLERKSTRADEPPVAVQ